jgi:hypothetical protein
MKKAISFVLVLVLGMAAMSLAAEYTWDQKADMPTSRFVHSASVVDGKIYVIGGMTSEPDSVGVWPMEVYELTVSGPPPDFNGDGIVDSVDMCIMVNHWGEDYSLCDIGLAPLGDGIVDTQDLIALSEYFFEDINDPTLAAHWALDETDGMVVADSAGDNNGYALGDHI